MKIKQYEELNTENTEAEQTTVKRHKKEKKHGGCLLGLLKIILVIALIVGVFLGYKYYKQQKIREEILSEVIVESLDAKLDIMKEIDSDIDGKTQYDKLEMGLSPVNGSDTDGDGLTDKEEIEVYNTDPLKVSSSGDNIPDSYKIANGMNVTDKVTDKSIINELFNIEDEFKEVELKDKVAENYGVNIREVDIKVSGVTPVKVFRVESYVGEVEIDFNEWLSDNIKYEGFIMTDAMYDNFETVKLKDGKIIADVNGAAYIGVTEKQKVFSADILESGDSSYVGGGKALIVRSPIMEQFGTPYIVILEHSYFNFSKEDRSEYFKQALYKKYNVPCTVTHTYIDSTGYTFIKGIFNLLKSGKIVEKVAMNAGADTEGASEAAMTASILFSMIWDFEEVDSGEWDMSFLNQSLIADNSKKEKPSEYMSTFDINVDAFPFKNVKTYASPGNCAGFAHITTQAFNGKFYDRVSSNSQIDNYGKSIDYDLSDGEFDTLFNRGLRDYKSTDYWTNTYESLTHKSSLSANDAQFINFLGYKWAEIINSEDNHLLLGNELTDWNQIEALKSFLSNGDRIVSVSMYGENGHAVNVYGMEQDSDNPDVWYLYIYDNNYPNNEAYGYQMNNKMKITKSIKRNLFGEDTVYYTYCWIPYSWSEKYKYEYYGDWTIHNKTSSVALGVMCTLFNAHGLDFIDEDLNFIR